MESQRVGVREGGVDDFHYVEELGKRVVADSVAKFRMPIPGMIDISYERLLTFVENQSHLIIVGQIDGVDAGFLLFLDTMQDEVTLMPQAFVAFMAVELWARRKGVARAMLDEAERYARQRGLPTLSMMVTEENVAARTLYEEGGFFTERRLLTKCL